MIGLRSKLFIIIAQLNTMSLTCLEYKIGKTYVIERGE